MEIAGRELVTGTLWIHERGGQTATFQYADSYLTNPDSYELDPALPKSSGMFHTPSGKAMFGAFADSAPDRWGENLMRREERERARATASALPQWSSSATSTISVAVSASNWDT
ncbi:MAG TPA: HipA N-terminal domain-containing protein [Trebonia sp.]